MFYILFIILLFIFSVIVHIFLCRKTVKAGLQAKAFVYLSLIFLGIYVVVVLIVQDFGMLDPSSLWGLPFKITSGIIFILLVPVYLCFYVLTQLTSPSKLILTMIAKRVEVSGADILLSVQQEDFIASRLHDLCASGCVKNVNGRYMLSKEGQKIAAILNVMQTLLGRKMGG